MASKLNKNASGDSGGIVYHVHPQTRVAHTIGVNMGSCPDGHQVYVTARSVKLSLQARYAFHSIAKRKKIKSVEYFY